MKRLFAVFLLFLILPLFARAEEGAVEFIRFDWKTEPTREQFYAATTRIYEALGPDPRSWLYSEYDNFNGVYVLTLNEEEGAKVRNVIAETDFPFLSASLKMTEPGQSPLHEYLQYVPHWNETIHSRDNPEKMVELAKRAPTSRAPACEVVLHDEMGPWEVLREGSSKMTRVALRRGHIVGTGVSKGPATDLFEITFTFAFAADCAHKDEIVDELMAVMNGK
ncbi:hypothetical protein [Emcibacter nanhaiensis]|uniref:Uncharacterized protein n=1 Tax=Emcibacter nanhaiensis TaxID=1505037 RepID=A0A501PBF6_9PROT|nr:hypothetical protein [Emcibacter nanhaiensis]TPD57703.1 hypothetical protein FIV46_16500 [Emcibacter nanhaiensis]